MKRIRYLMVLLVVLFMFCETASAGSRYDMTTDAYDVEVQIREDNSWNFKETVRVDFAVEKHGVYRYIPLENSSGQRAMVIDDVDVENWEFDAYTENEDGIEYHMIKIGDPDETVTGPQRFTMHYTARLYDDLNPDGDMLYIDLLPTDWESPIGTARIQVYLPKDISQEFSSGMEVYASAYGENTASENVSWEYNPDTRMVSIEGRDLPQGMGITLYCPLPEGYWDGEMRNRSGEITAAAAGFAGRWGEPLALGMSFLIPAVIVLLWFVFGRDQKIPVSETCFPPRGMNPAEVGFVADGEANHKDLMALIPYFANKGYLSIYEYEEDKIQLIRLREMGAEEKTFAKLFFDGLFRDAEADASGRTAVKLDELPPSFTEAYNQAMGDLISRWSKAKSPVTPASSICMFAGMLLLLVMLIGCAVLAALYSGNSELGYMSICMVMLAIFGILLLVVVDQKQFVMGSAAKSIVFLLGLLLTGGACVLHGIVIHAVSDSAIIAYSAGLSAMAGCILTTYMPQRTAENRKLLGEILGLRTYMEKEELPKLDEMGESISQAAYFYDILPYAYVFGLTDKWAKTFENVVMTQPQWYGSCRPMYEETEAGRMLLWNCIWMNQMMQHCSDSVAGHIFSTETHGDGGGGSFSGGGGFSGGGFGGGGGGSW